MIVNWGTGISCSGNKGGWLVGSAETQSLELQSCRITELQSYRVAEASQPRIK